MFIIITNCTRFKKSSEEESFTKKKQKIEKKYFIIEVRKHMK